MKLLLSTQLLALGGGATVCLTANGTANTGAPYWDWVKFTTAAGSYNSGSSSATRGSSSSPT